MKENFIYYYRCKNTRSEINATNTVWHPNEIWGLQFLTGMILGFTKKY